MPERVEASVFDNAYTFYQKYNNDMAFQPGEDKEGEIFYATKGKKAVSSGTQYTTIGWKVTIKNGAGKTIATLYYQLGGNHMTTIDTQLVDGYEYTLYKVTLSNVRSRISNTANEALRTANCSIMFDACLALKINGVIQGGMTDNGPSWGNVYTTYSGIAGAASWSDSTKETLKTYFNKTVEDIYYTVELSKGTGIAEVTGDGRYCFGTTVTIGARVENKYVFKSWTGDYTSKKSEYTFTIYTDVTMKANASKQNLTVSFYKDSSGGESCDATKIYYNDTSGQYLPDFKWKKRGMHQTGWSLTKGATSARYKLTNVVTQSWIDKHIPSVELYAVWEENSYTLVYDVNGGEGQIADVTVAYSGEVILPEQGVTREGYALLGWSTEKDSAEPEYVKGENVIIKNLAALQGVEYTHEAEITLYAVWDNAPVITVEPMYVTLDDAQKGIITEEWLLYNASAEDIEDGELAVSIVDYSTVDFTSFKKDGAVSETFIAQDSAGNITKKRVWIYIVDTVVYDADLVFGRIRFISKDYYKAADGTFISSECGGLMENSIWRIDKAYTTLLDDLYK